MNPSVVIIGAGMAGMAAAAHLAELGVACTVLEARAVVGGRAATVRETTVEHGGMRLRFPIEHGIHGIFYQYPNLRRLMESHGGLHDWRVPQPSVVFRDQRRWLRGTFHTSFRGVPLPSLVALIAFTMNPTFRRIFVREGALRQLSTMLMVIAHSDARDHESIRGLPASVLLKDATALQRRLFKSLVRSGAFAEVDEIGLSALLCGLRVYAYGDKNNIRYAVCPRHIGADLFAPLVEAVKSAGGRVLLERPALAIESTSDGILVHTPAGPVQGDALILAVDPGAHHALFPSGPLAVPSGHHKTRGTTVVRLWFEADGCPAGDAETFVIADGRAEAGFWLHRLQMPFRRWHDHCGGSVLELHLYGEAADWSATVADGAIVEEVVQTVEEVWPVVAHTLVHADVQRNPAHVIWGPGALAEAHPVTTPDPRIARAGDWIATPHPYVFHLERATLTGLLAARTIAPQLSIAPESLAVPLLPGKEAISVRALRLALKGLQKLGVLPRLGGP